MLSVFETADALGVAPLTIRRLIRRGELNAYKVGRVIRIKPADVDEYLERHAV